MLRSLLASLLVAGTLLADAAVAQAPAAVSEAAVSEAAFVAAANAESAEVGQYVSQRLWVQQTYRIGLLIDKWRWEVFAGRVPPERYNEAWWGLRRRHQGVTPPEAVDGGARPADAFDAGAKYHIPANTPYMRSFLSYIFQYQFHRAACRMAGWEGPLHRCSVYGNAEVGRRFREMLALGSSRPWQEALETFTGERALDASALVAYDAPLKTWLDARNQGRRCGW